MYELETQIELMFEKVEAKITFSVDDVGGIQTIDTIEIIDDEGDAHNVYSVFKHNKKLEDNLCEHILEESYDWNPICEY